MSQENIQKTINVEELKKLFPEINREPSGQNLNWSVREWKGEIFVEWDYTFRRNTRVGAYKENASRIQQANQRLSVLAEQFKALAPELNLYTMENAKKGDDWADSNGDSPYSEYEQSFGSSIKFKK